MMVMYKTHVRPIRDLRNNYADIDKIVNDHDHVIITNNGRGTSVLIGIVEYTLYEEFLHTLYIKRKLDEAEASASDPNTRWLSERSFGVVLRIRNEIQSGILPEAMSDADEIRQYISQCYQSTVRNFLDI